MGARFVEPSFFLEQISVSGLGEVGDHILHICQVDKFLGDEDKKGLYAWNGFGKVAPAVEG